MFPLSISHFLSERYVLFRLKVILDFFTVSSFSLRVHLLNAGYLWRMCVCVCVCVCLCVYTRPFTVKASSVWISWSTRDQINDVVLKTYISNAKFLHCYSRMKHLTFLTSHFILFTHQKRAKPRLNQCASHFENMGSSATIIRHRLCFALHHKLICLWRLH